MSKIEERIIQARLKGPSFCQLSAEEQRYVTDEILFHGAAITGSGLPETEMFAEAVSFEFINFLSNCLEGELTLHEILEAIRFTALGDLRWPSGDYVERPAFKGQCFHVTFLAQAASIYCSLRGNLDRKLQNLIDGY